MRAFKLEGLVFLLNVFLLNPMGVPDLHVISYTNTLFRMPSGRLISGVLGGGAPQGKKNDCVQAAGNILGYRLW